MHKARSGFLLGIQVLHGCNNFDHSFKINNSNLADNVKMPRKTKNKKKVSLMVLMGLLKHPLTERDDLATSKRLV
jgi:hypothetical protein